MSQSKVKLSLKNVGKRRPTREESEKMWGEVAEGSDRTAAILGTIQVENALRTFLLANMFNSDEIEEALTGRDGPLASFYSSTHLAFGMALINEDLFSDLKIIRHIRNVFAHSDAAVDFDVPEISAECLKLKTALSSKSEVYQYVHKNQELDLTLPRDRFIMTCLGAAEFLMIQALLATQNSLESLTKAVNVLLESKGLPHLKKRLNAN